MSHQDVQYENAIQRTFNEIRPSDFKKIVKGVSSIRADKLESSLTRATLAFVRGKLPSGIPPDIVNRFNLSDLNAFNTDRHGEPTTILSLPVRAYRIEVGEDYRYLKRVYCMTGHIARERWILTLYPTHLTIEQPEPELVRGPIFYSPL